MATSRKHRITLLIEWQSIYRDIADKCDMLAKAVRLAAGKDEELGELLEGEIKWDDDASNFIRREMTTALSFIQIELNKWIWDNGHLATARIIKEDTIKVIAHTPTNWDLSMRYPLARLIETYLVNRAMMMWCTMYHKQDAATYKTLADEAMQGIKRIKTRTVHYYSNTTEVDVIVGDSGSTPTSTTVDVQTVSLSSSKASLYNSKSMVLRANISPTNATTKTLTWAASSTLVTLTPSTDTLSCTVTAASSGTGTESVTATAASGVKASCTVIVKAQSTSSGGSTSGGSTSSGGETSSGESEDNTGGVEEGTGSGHNSGSLQSE